MFVNGDRKAAVNIAETGIRAILHQLGEDINREGLQETPKRYVKFLDDFINNKEEFNFTTFTSESDEMIIVHNIPFASLCEHHMLPFFGHGHIAYVPGVDMAGLSKLPRTLEYFARGLKNQERITKEVAEFIQNQINPIGVAVSLTAEHTCMTIRGAKAIGTKTTTNKLLGCFKDKPEARAEFFNAVHANLMK